MSTASDFIYPVISFKDLGRTDKVKKDNNNNLLFLTFHEEERVLATAILSNYMINRRTGKTSRHKWIKKDKYLKGIKMLKINK